MYNINIDSSCVLYSLYTLWNQTWQSKILYIYIYGVFWGKSSINGGFSIAMFDYQRVSIKFTQANLVSANLPFAWGPLPVTDIRFCLKIGYQKNDGLTTTNGDATPITLGWYLKIYGTPPLHLVVYRPGPL